MILKNKKEYIHSEETRKRLSLSHKGKMGYWKGKKFSEEHKKKLKESFHNNPYAGMKGKHPTEETKQKISLANKGKHHSWETQFKIGHIQLNTGRTHFKEGMKHTEEWKKMMSEKLKGRTSPMLGKKHSDEWKDKMSKIMKGKKLSENTKKKIGEKNRISIKKLWQNQEYKEKQLNSIRLALKDKPISKELKEKISKIKKREYLEGKNKSAFKKGYIPWIKDKKHMEETKNKMSKNSKIKWQNQEYAKKQHASIQKCPNKKELKLNTILKNNFPNLFEMTVGGKFVIEGYNPDFVCRNHKKIIELFGKWFHTFPKSIERDQKKIEIYQKYGFKTLVIWDYELNKLPEQEIVNKINEFIKC